MRCWSRARSRMSWSGLTGGKVRQSAYSQILLLTLAVAACSPTAAYAQPDEKPQSATVVGGWAVSQRTFGCAISRSVRSELSSSPTLWRPFRGEMTIHLNVTLQNHAPASIGETTGTLRFVSGPSIPVRVGWLIQLQPGLQQQQVAILKLERRSEHRFRASLLKVSIAQVDVVDKTLEMTLPTADVWQQADQCLTRVGEALLTASPPAYRNGSLPDRSSPVPRITSGAWLDSNSYPKEALKTKAQGDTRVALTVDRYGYPISWQIVQSSGFKILDDRTCARLLSRAHFYPALDSAGLASEGKWETTVKWQVP
jgi:TonB family protein